MLSQPKLLLLPVLLICNLAFYGQQETKKTINVGNVTELGYVYGFLCPNNIKLDSVNNLTSLNSHSVVLSQYFIVNNYLVQFGVEYSIAMASQHFTHNSFVVDKQEVVVNDTINTHYYIVNGDSVAEHVINTYTKTISDTTYNTQQYTSKWQVQQISIPVNLGYRWRFNNFALYAKLGASFNFIAKLQKSTFNAQTGELYSVSYKPENPFAVNALASVALEYPFSDWGSIIIEPQYQFSTNNTSYTLNNVSRCLGVKAGLQYWF